MKYTLIIPAAGKSSRFPNMRPKWMLTHPSGHLMVGEAIRGLNLEAFDEILFVCLREHQEKYHFRDGLMQQFEDLGQARKLRVIELAETTRHQPETVVAGLTQGAVDGPFCVKDTDNYFALNAQPINFVSVFDLDQMALVNAANKSYVVFDENRNISNIVEKSIVSKTFCTGLYGFAASAQFRKYYDRLKDSPNLYISHIIFQMLLDNVGFQALACKSYIDWGTLQDWNRFKSQYAVFFVDLDGTLVKNSGQHFQPVWGTTKGIPENIAVINKLYESGKVQIIITTSRKEMARETTLAQLEREGIKYHRLVFDLYHGRRVVINDYSTTNPYRSCDAINIKRDTPELASMIENALGANFEL
jgi:hypothetical protein